MDRHGGSGAFRIARRLIWLVPAVAIAADAGLESGAAAESKVQRVTTTLAPPMARLPGSLQPKARPELDIGRMAPSVRLSGMSMLFRMTPAQRAFLKRELAAVQDPASPRYHQWLTPEQYAGEFGATTGEVTKATDWLTSQGLVVDGPSRTATRLAFSGTVAQVERAFRTEIHRYAVDGEAHFAMDRAPSVPADLAELVLGLHGLHDFRAKASSHSAMAQYALPITEPDGGAGTYLSLSPADFAKIYDVDALYAAHITGAGQSIAVAEQSDFNDADIAAFRKTFGLSDNPPVRVLVPNTGSAAANGNLFEAELDLEWSGAVAPDATIQCVFTGDAPNHDASDALTYAIEQRIAPVISTSFGRCESWFTEADATFAEAYGDLASLEGITVLADAGDTGAAACDSQSALSAQYGEAVLLPASLPSFVAVGGSQLDLNQTNQSTYFDSRLYAVSYIPESAWNETLGDIDAGYGGLGAGGGGASRLFAKPYWQVPFTIQDGARDVPDLALSASADLLPYAVSTSWTAADGDAEAPQDQALTAVGGTSLAAPSLAGVFALVNQAVSATNPGLPVGLGNVNPLLYALANSASSKSAFHDITDGNNVVPCEPGSSDCPASPPYQFGFTAGQGYDQTTGLGSIDAANLVAAWVALAPTSTSLGVAASGTVEGSPLQLTASITTKTTTTAMTGSVLFYFVSSGSTGIGSSGTLGTARILPGTSTSTATASLTVGAPGGLDGSRVQIGAFYGGDTHYLASWSPMSSLSFASSLVICPTAVALSAGQTGFAFTTAGGTPPIQWSLHLDTTCTMKGTHIACSTIDGGAFTAGPTAGHVTAVAIDKDESYATAEGHRGRSCRGRRRAPPTASGFVRAGGLVRCLARQLRVRRSDSRRAGRIWF